MWSSHQKARIPKLYYTVAKPFAKKKSFEKKLLNITDCFKGGEVSGIEIEPIVNLRRDAVNFRNTAMYRHSERQENNWFKLTSKRISASPQSWALERKTIRKTCVAEWYEYCTKTNLNKEIGVEPRLIYELNFSKFISGMDFLKTEITVFVETNRKKKWPNICLTFKQPCHQQFLTADARIFRFRLLTRPIKTVFLLRTLCLQF